MNYQKRRITAFIAMVLGMIAWLVINPVSFESEPSPAIADGNVDSQDIIETPLVNAPEGSALEILENLAVKGRAPKTGYTREQFYNGWPTVDGCNLRQRILKREFGDSAVLDGCTVLSGEFDEPYTGKHMVYEKREDITKGVQIDHVVALSDAWQKGAQNLTAEERYQIATDPLNLLAVDASTNQKKSDGDAATWLPPNKSFRCTYVARQVSVKYKYHLWVTEAEKNAIVAILNTCPNEPAVGI